MDVDQCHARAAECAANALAATDDAVSQEFLRLAAQWRALAVRTIVLASAGEADAVATPDSLAPAVGLIAPRTANTE